ncbi:peptidyl-tRNA hydrolase 2, mitochondrial-like isoform X2 [Adelges cooleyi]|uniref:peptidyl-tRNA hydrolase 2, mitochondrial-like isoform X2 n=1 Tax=Adelges cooleyi TaxID=133065 RepID=UPI002180689F|nr:peptidyl-tRNA hydrolase 2, mitochondrial-like isoform X2 [Adelges cooleyi]
MVFLQEYALDTFFKGLIIGVITGVVLNKVPNYIYSLIRNNRIIKDEVKSNSKPEPVSSTKDEYKMALLVRHDLKMGKGKVAAQCAAVSVTAYNKGKLCRLPSKCARVVLRAPDIKTIEYITEQCKQVGIQTAEFIENGNITVLAIGPAITTSIDNQVKNFKLY